MTSPQTERQQSVLDLLQNLKGQDPLKKLFWTELNYDRVNSPLSRKGWGDQASIVLADDPVLFATGSKDFHVIRARLKADRPLMGMEGPVVSRLLQEHPYALFIFSNASRLPVNRSDSSVITESSPKSCRALPSSRTT